MRTATIRQVQNGYVLEEESGSTYVASMTTMSFPEPKTTKVFTSLEETLREIVKGMAPDVKSFSIDIKV